MTPGSEWYTNQLSTSYELQVNILTNCLIARVTSSILRTSYQLLFIAQVASYFLHTGYELLFVARVTRYIYCKSYKLLFIVRVTSSSLLHELRVIAYCMCYELLFIAGITSYIWHTSSWLIFMCKLGKWQVMHFYEDSFSIKTYLDKTNNIFLTQKLRQFTYIQ